MPSLRMATEAVQFEQTREVRFVPQGEVDEGQLMYDTIEAKKNLKIWSKLVQDLNAELEKNRDKLDNNRDELENTRNELANTRNGLENTKNELENTRNELENTRNELARTRNSKDIAHVRIVDMEAKNKKLVAELCTIKTERDDFERQNSNYDEQIKTRDQTIEALEKKAVCLQRELAENKDADLVEDNDDMIAEPDDPRKQLEQRRNQPRTNMNSKLSHRHERTRKKGPASTSSWTTTEGGSQVAESAKANESRSVKPKSQKARRKTKFW